MIIELIITLSKMVQKWKIKFNFPKESLYNIVFRNGNIQILFHFGKLSILTHPYTRYMHISHFRG